MELLIPAIIVVVLFVCYAALIVYYRQSWLQVPEYKLSIATVNRTPITKITVIIPARNEESNIARCLQAVLGQDYPADLFEIIVVDDHSTDGTVSIVQSFSQPNVRCILLKDFVTDSINSYKKKAIEVAIAQSTGHLIVTTDADCFMGIEWLQTIAVFYQQYHPACIAAPVSISCSNRFIEIFQALDFMTLQGITGAAVHKKMHSMCNGANFVYEKIAYYEVGGFAGIDEIASGDDMLLMQKIYNRYPDRVSFLKSKEAIVTTQPISTWKGFLNQRVRWASKADKYDDKRIFGVLLLVYFFNLLLLLLPIIATAISQVAVVIIFWFSLLILKTIVEFLFLFPMAKFFSKQQILWWFPLAQPLHILYTVIAGWLGKFGKYSWKSRNVK
jgi:cellulose synthase/poly-beta-1,6-N-acetylglucosamine synthase-like glycosyltransferase